MKNFKFIFFLALILAFTVPIETQAQTTLLTSGSLQYDTLTNGETLDFYFGTAENLFKPGYKLVLMCKADTLSGTDAVITAQPIAWIGSDTGWGLIGSAVTVIDTSSRSSSGSRSNYKSSGTLR